MRKLGTFLLLVALAVSAVGCSGDITQPTPSGSPPSANFKPSAPPSPPPIPPAPKQGG